MSIRVVQHPEKGRILVASKAVVPLELILEDLPCVTGPQVDVQTLVCLGCFAEIDGSFLCSHCSIPMCSRDCCSEEQHRKFECPLFASRSLILPDYRPLMSCILILRLALLKGGTSSGPLHHLISDLMDHNVVRRRDQTSWDNYQTRVTQFILEGLRMHDVVSLDTLNRCIGIMRTNVIQTQGQSRGQVMVSFLYPTMAILSHSCACNARCVKKWSLGNKIEIYAQVAIENDDEVTIQYTSLLSSTRSRREAIKRNWCFDCHCSRCCDPSELGSELGTFRCQHCAQGLVRLVHPLAYASDYACDSCLKVVELGVIRDLENELENALIEASQKRGREYVRALLNLVEQERFHPSHYLLMRIKSELISHLGNIPGYFYFELTSEMIRMKRDICIQFIDVFSKVDPGWTDWRGTTLYELSNTRTTLAQRNFDQGQLLLPAFQDELSAVIKINQEAIPMLEIEDEESHAFDIGLRARKNVVDLKDLLRFAEFL